MNDLLRAWLNLPPQASTFAPDVDALHYVVIGTTSLGVSFVFVLAIVLVIRYRRRQDNITVESTLALGSEVSLAVSFLVLFLAFWVVGAIQYNRMRTPPANAMVVYVTAKQWMWKFAYPNGSEAMDVLTVPVHQPVKLVMTSRDVIHSFYVPAFRMKQDVLPGRFEIAWFEATQVGRYPVECAEYCGVSHSRMGAMVQVLSAEDYARWKVNDPSRLIADDDAPRADDLVRVGERIAVQRGCLSCHTIDGQRHLGPTWARLYGSTVRLTDDTEVTADEAYLTRSMMDPAAQIVWGYQAIMPTYFGLIEAPEVAALVEYIKSLAHVSGPPTIALPPVSPAANVSQGQRP